MVYCHYNFLEHPRTSELNFIAVHGHIILILKSDICSAYMSIHTHKRWHLQFLLPIDLLEICMFSFIEIMIVTSDFIQSLNPTTSSPSG